MHNVFKVGFKTAVLVIIVTSLQSNNVYGQKKDELIKELYEMYTEAVHSAEPIASLRRFLKPNEQYSIHIKRLKEVNGFKRHNLLIKQETRSGDNPIVYINNPVESKIPNAYLTLEEFKVILAERVKKKIDEFNKQNRLKANNLITTREPKSEQTTGITTTHSKHKRTNKWKTSTKKPDMFKMFKMNSNFTNDAITFNAKVLSAITNTDIKTTERHSEFETNSTSTDGEIKKGNETDNIGDMSTHIIEQITHERQKYYITTDRVAMAALTQRTEPTANSKITLSNINENVKIVSPFINTESETDYVFGGPKDGEMNSTKIIGIKPTTRTFALTSLNNLLQKSSAEKEKIKKELDDFSSYTKTKPSMDQDSSVWELEDSSTSSPEPASTTTITVSTKLTRKTLGRPRVFMGG